MHPVTAYGVLNGFIASTVPPHGRAARPKPCLIQVFQVLKRIFAQQSVARVRRPLDAVYIGPALRCSGTAAWCYRLSPALGLWLARRSPL